MTLNQLDILHFFSRAGGFDWANALLPAMVPIFLLSALAEWWYQSKQQRHPEDFQKKDIAANISLGLSYLIIETLMKSFLVTAVSLWVYQHRIAELEISFRTFLPIFLGVEFCYYLFHFSAHRVRWFWAAHVPHHSGRHMTFTTATRQSVLNALVGNFLFFLPLSFLGIHPSTVAFMLSVNLAFQFFIHTNLVKKLPSWIEFIFNTPSHHRVHHGKNSQYIDKNFGGILIIFDRLFGTFEPEMEAPVYGIVKQVDSYNPLILNFHEFVDMVKDALRPGPLPLRLKHFWAPPDWERPTGNGKGPTP